MKSNPILPKVGESVHFRSKIRITDENLFFKRETVAVHEAVGKVVGPPIKGYIQIEVEGVQELDGQWPAMAPGWKIAVCLDDVDL